MELSQLKYFRELAQQEHLTKTAKYLNITPPSLSISISKLEQELGTPLFEHIGRNIRLNPNGRLFLKYVNYALETLEIGVRKLQANVRNEQNIFRLGITAQTLWLEGIQAFMKNYPQCSVSRENIYLDQINNKVFMSKFDFVLTALQDLSSQEWEYCVLIPNDAPVLVLSKGHPWSERKEIALEEAASEPFILLPKNYSSRRFADTLCKVANITPRVIAECDYMLRAQLLHTEKRAVTISTKLGMTSSLLSDLHFIPIRTTAPPRSQTLFWQKGHKLSFSELLFKEFLRFYYTNNIIIQ